MKTFLLSVVLIFFSACNHLFFYPDSVEYSHPSDRHLVVDEHWLQSSSGNKLHLWRIRAPNISSVRASVLHFHGNAQNMSAHLAFVEWLTAHGYELVTFDYSGYGRSEGKADRHALIQDSISVLRWWQETSPALPRFVVAQSLGVALATWALSSADDVSVSGLVLDSGFASYRGLARKKLASVWLTWLLQWPLSFLISDEYSPIERAGQLSLPVLVFHSANDPVVPRLAGRELYEALTAADKQWILVKEAGHTLAMVGKEAKFHRRLILDFFGRLSKEWVLHERSVAGETQAQ